VTQKKKISIVLIGNNKDLLSQFAAKIRSFRPPEPYKGKGIKFVNESIRRKEGKKK
jgi:large subunit ribosomal protein L6